MLTDKQYKKLHTQTLRDTNLPLSCVLQNVAKFKEVVTIPSEALTRKIHTTYRMGYIKDAILPRVLDDVTFAALHSMMMFNYIEILNGLQQDATFFRDLFDRLKNGDTSSEYWATLVAFVQELGQLAMHPQYSAYVSPCSPPFQV